MLGRVSAAVARVEFLLGTIYHQGGRWERSSNRGFMVDFYTDRTPWAWCSRFATTILAQITGRRSLLAFSGYKIANPGRWNIDLDYDQAQGGAFVGMRRSRRASPDPRSRNYSPWAELRQTLRNFARGRAPGQTKEQAAQAFLQNHVQPQAGDILVVTRGGRRNSFSGGSSHTGMIERVEGFKIYTIEGNTGRGSNRVIGGVYDLTSIVDVGKSFL